ncbi:MAG: leucine-rich repeat protein, partial [Clostridia bacterium]|nr:leucine-rich repeat protein [Clostridia bacterium]
TCTEQARCEDCGGAYGALLEHTYEGEENGGACIYCHTTYLEETVEFRLSEDGRSYVLFDAYNYKLESIVIPEKYRGLPVTEIGELAFDSSTIRHVVLPNTLKVIGGCAFSCSQLETINLHMGIREIGGDAFCATKIKSIVFPGTVEILEGGLFAHCEQLEQVIIQDGIKHIGWLAFDRCPNLKTVVFPNTLESTGGELFKDSPAVEYNTYGGLRYIGTATNPFFAVVGSTGATNAIIHPDTEICILNALLNCEKIAFLEIGAKVRIIEEWALTGMDALETITVAAGNSNYYVINNILMDARINMPILGCKTSLIPDDGTFSEFNLRIFGWNDSIKAIYIPEGVKTVHVDFDRLRGLEMIIIESDVEKIIVYGNSDGCRSNGEVETPCFAVYHCHTEDAWKQVSIEYTFDRNAMIHPTDCYGDRATHYFYSETQPQGEGNYWHYVDGVPTPW